MIWVLQGMDKSGTGPDRKFSFKLNRLFVF